MGLFDFFRRKKSNPVPHQMHQVSAAERQAQQARWERQRRASRDRNRQDSYGRIARWVQIRMASPTEQEARVHLAYAGVQEYPAKVILRQQAVREILALSPSDNAFSSFSTAAANPQQQVRQSVSDEERKAAREKARRESYGRIARWIQARMAAPSELEARVQLAYAGISEENSKAILCQPMVREILSLSPDDAIFSGFSATAVAAQAAQATEPAHAQPASQATAVTSPSAAGMTLSEDGQWAWNGSEWVPAPAPTPSVVPIALDPFQPPAASSSEPESSLTSIFGGAETGHSSGAAGAESCGYPACPTSVSHFDFRCFSCRKRFCVSHKGSSIDCLLCQSG